MALRPHQGPLASFGHTFSSPCLAPCFPPARFGGRTCGPRGGGVRIPGKPDPRLCRPCSCSALPPRFERYAGKGIAPFFPSGSEGRGIEASTLVLQPRNSPPPLPAKSEFPRPTGGKAGKFSLGSALLQTSPKANGVVFTRYFVQGKKG